jgi:hypothetical protein
VAFCGVRGKEGKGGASRKDAFSLKWLRLSDGRCSLISYTRFSILLIAFTKLYIRC